MKIKTSVREQFDQKEQWHKAQAKLPIEKKIDILGQLQERYRETLAKIDRQAIQNLLKRKRA